jgi:hypothetical protein
MLTSTTSWDSLWARSPEFGHGWRISSVIRGVGLLIDAALRVVLAYTLPADVVPALSAALIPLTVIILALIDQVNQRATGVRRLILACADEAGA